MASLVITKPKNRLDWDIAELELSVSAWKVLKKKGIKTIRDLIALTSEEGWAIRRYPIGVYRSREIAETLDAWHLAKRDALLGRAGYPMQRYRQEPVYLSRMVLNMPPQPHSQAEAL